MRLVKSTLHLYVKSRSIFSPIGHSSIDKSQVSLVPIVPRFESRSRRVFPSVLFGRTMSLLVPGHLLAVRWGHPMRARINVPVVRHWTGESPRRRITIYQRGGLARACNLRGNRLAVNPLEAQIVLSQRFTQYVMTSQRIRLSISARERKTLPLAYRNCREAIEKNVIFGKTGFQGH